MNDRGQGQSPPVPPSLRSSGPMSCIHGPFQLWERTSYFAYARSCRALSICNPESPDQSESHSLCPGNQTPVIILVPYDESEAWRGPHCHIRPVLFPYVPPKCRSWIDTTFSHMQICGESTGVRRKALGSVGAYPSIASNTGHLGFEATEP